ncbi:protein kinase domain-containing protein [Pseudovibrio ascidiaceicola]|uniref:protein kinase domain-containing protein n=1 Tax=Pseudovibrio ascidiaceicola TaxID=285279 RepID=UPI003D36042B
MIKIVGKKGEFMAPGNDREQQPNENPAPDHENWVQAMGQELNLQFGPDGEGEQIPVGGPENQVPPEVRVNDAEVQPPDAPQDPPAQGMPNMPPLAVPMQDRPNEQPKAGSRMQVEYKENGTMVIDPYSVPRTIATGHGAGLDGVRHAVYAPTRLSTDVEGKITPPLQGDALAQQALGRGGTGYLQTYPDMEDAVIKRPYSFGEGENQQFLGMESIIHETTILSALGEFEGAKGVENIIKVKGSGVTGDGEPFVIMENLKGGTLDDRIANEGLPPAQLDQFAEGLLSGISFLQNRNVIHQDLKIDNIMFREQDSVEPVIIDFNAASATEGIAATTDDYEEFRYERDGEPNMQPPEKQGNEINLAKITPKADSWTGGLCLAAAVIGKQSQQQLIQEARQAGEDQVAIDAALDARLGTAPEHIKVAIKGMMRADVAERLTAEQALELMHQNDPNYVPEEQPQAQAPEPEPQEPERVYNEDPKEGSPIRVQRKRNGTLVIEPDSVPTGVQMVQQRRGRDAGARGNVYGPTRHSLRVNQHVPPPIVDGNHDQPGVLAHGATGVLQDFPHMENAVLKRPNAVQIEEGEPLTFIGVPQILREAKILTALSDFDEAKGYENIPQIKGTGITDAQEPFMVMEKLKGGNLAERIPEDKGLPEEQAEAFANGLLNGLDFLHKRNIVHQDLKPNNIMFREEGDDVPVIIDYDLATAHEGVATGTGDGEPDGFDLSGTPDIMPPEARNPGPNNENLSEKIDAWSAGLLLVTAVAGSSASDLLKRDLIDFRNGANTDSTQLRVLLERHLAGVPQNMKEAIIGLLKLNPTTRLSAEQALTLINHAKGRPGG